MRAFVTGGTGLLGNNLVRALTAAGHDVLALVRSEEKAARELGDTSARLVLGDLTDVPALAGALKGVDAVFHTAAYFREYYAPGDHTDLESINVDATLELARAASAAGVKKMIYTSSAGLIGMKPDGSAGDETTPPAAVTRNNLYLRSKLYAERRLFELAKELRFFVASAMPTWMWGPHDAGPTPSGQLVVDALRGKLPPAVPPGGADVVDARDVAEAMLRIAAVGRSGERYILSQGHLDLGQIMAMLAKKTGTKIPTARLPYFLALTLAAGAETWSKLVGTPSAMSIEAIRLMNARLRVSTTKAEQELGVRFRPFEETVAASVDWTRTRTHPLPKGEPISRERAA